MSRTLLKTGVMMNSLSG